MSKTAEKLYDLCLQVAASRHYEIDVNDVQDAFLSSDGIAFEFAPEWILHQYESDEAQFWFTFAPDYSGILHADNLVDLLELLEQFLAAWNPAPAGWDSVEA